MSMVGIVFRRELASFFATPVAYVFITIFLILSGVFAFFIGSLFERGQADLLPFFNFHPWLYLFLVPAIAMRTWSEERKNGSIELLMTLPITTFQAMLGKFLAAWSVLGLSLILTFPLWLTVNYLGDPDNGVILAAYIGSWLMSGAFLSIGICMSALTKNQVVAFILAIVVCFIFVVSGSGIVLDAFKGWAPSIVIDTVACFRFVNHF
jgi:ABC-2 type transport system permease protein